MHMTASAPGSTFSEKSIEFRKSAGMIIFDEDRMHSHCARSHDVAWSIVEKHCILRSNPKLLERHLINPKVGFANTNRR